MPDCMDLRIIEQGIAVQNKIKHGYMQKLRALRQGMLHAKY